jgi:pilus assembly protein Flp/PilA
MKNLIQRFIREEEGQDIIEYALLAAFISICAVLIITAIGPSVSYRYSQVASAVSTNQ